MALQFHLNNYGFDPEDLTWHLRPDLTGAIPESSIKVDCLPAEWFPQSGVQLTWPHENTDWAPILKEVNTCYIRMAMEISLRERLLIITPDTAAVAQLLKANLPEKALIKMRLDIS